MGIEAEKPNCLFYNEDGSLDYGGCTKEWLDANGGDPSKLFALGGGYLPKFSFAALMIFMGLTWEVDGDDLAMSISPTANIEAGMVAYINFDQIQTIPVPQRVEVLEYSGTSVKFASPTIPTANVSSIVYAGNATVNFNGPAAPVIAGQKIKLSGFANSENNIWVTVETASPGSFTVAPTYGLVNDATGIASPAIEEIYIGGACSDLQEVLDEGDAEFNDCWVFCNSDIAEDLLSLYQGDGDYVNNTKKYIVGYKDNCYDALPSGRGYFPDSIGNGQYYKTPIEWLRLSIDGSAAENDALFKASLTEASPVGAVGGVFKIINTTENIKLMGFYTKNPAGTTQGMVFYENDLGEHITSVEVEHCVNRDINYESKRDASALFCGNGCFIFSAGYFESSKIRDCLGLGSVMLYDMKDEGTSRTEISHCVRVLSYKVEGELDYHHNIDIDCREWIRADKNTHVNLWNNTIYGVTEAPFWMKAVEGNECLVNAWNNIVITNRNGLVNNADRVGLYFENGGGTVDAHHNCYYDHNPTGDVWSPVSPIVASGRTNANWNEPQIGESDIEANPMFADIANYDFRPTNPAIITGGRPASGVDTYMGAIPPKLNSRSNARVANFGRLATVRS